MPDYSTDYYEGMDIRANLEENVILEPMERIPVPTDLFLEITEGYEAQIRPGSDLVIRHGVTILHTSGTIDADYGGEVCKINIDFSNENFVIGDGDRICQMVIAKQEKVERIKVGNLFETERGVGSFIHKGKE